MQRIVPALEQARLHRGRKVKVAAISEALARVAREEDDDDLATAARMIAGSILPLRDAAPLGVGFGLVSEAVAEAYDCPRSTLLVRARALGDLGDAVEEIALPSHAARPRVGLTLVDVRALASAIAAASDRATKRDVLRTAYARARPAEAKYLTKVLLGELRIGVRAGILEEAIAAAFGRDAEDVHATAALCRDPGDLAVLARQGELSRAAFTLGSPIAFMLASPIETVRSDVEPSRTVWEDKLDGIRVQVHARAGFVAIFSRGGGDVTDVFPEVRRAFEGVTRDVVLDGELLAIADDNRARPFQALQSRLNRRAQLESLTEIVPVALVAFDMLCDGELIVGLPWSERRAHLDAFFEGTALSRFARPTEVHRFDPLQAIDAQITAAYEAARHRGNEGIVLKAVDATYEAGRRGSAWRKVKRALATLDVVITRAERGHGKRAAVLSDYTFAVWTTGATPALVDIGKAYSGLTDAEISAMTKTLEALATGTFPGGILVEPTVVLEVAFDGIQPSTRHESGFALRFPRIVRIRSDKRPSDADTIETARALFDAQVATGHREAALPAHGPIEAQRRATAGRRPRKPRRGSAPKEQLGLFGDEEE
jgi:DNA ligase-1